MILYHKKIVRHTRRIRIRPFGDLQFGDPGFRQDLWDRWIKEAILDQDSFFIGMGDYSNSFRPTIAKGIKKIMVDDNEAHSELDYMIMKEMQGLAEKLKPIQDRIIGLHTGHHSFDFLNGTNSDNYLCQLLKCKYLGFVAFGTLGVEQGNRDKEKGSHNSRNITIFSTHGCGGSSQSSSDLANLERKILPFWDADIFLRGHSTKVYAAPGAPLHRLSVNTHGYDNMKIFKHQRWLVNCGGFMEGYTQNRTSYVEEKNMAPAALGWAVIEVHIKDTKGKSGESPIEISPTIFAPNQDD